MLGRLRPKLLLVTTPNYAFHVHFNRDPHNHGDPGFPDPTGKTSRRFRHSDHKFEWTTAEFRQWCHRIAKEYGYQVEVGGVGQAIYPPGVAEHQKAKARDVEEDAAVEEDDEDSIKYATQVALFRSKKHFPTSLATASAARRRQGQASEETEQRGRREQAVSSSSSGGTPAPTSTATSDSESNPASRRGSMARRRARSRQPELLPFLSDQRHTPEANTTTFSSLAESSSHSPSDETNPALYSSTSTLESATGTAAAEEPDLTGSRGSLRKDSGSPGYAHEIVYQRRVPSIFEVLADQNRGEDGEPLEEADRAASPAEIEDKVLDVLNSLTTAALSGETETKYVAARLWDIWVDDRARIACRGRYATLLDAFQIAEPSAQQLSQDPLRDLGVLVGTSPKHEWMLRVWTDADYGNPDLYLFYAGPEMATWDLPGAITEFHDEAQDPEDEEDWRRRQEEEDEAFAQEQEQERLRQQAAQPSGVPAA